MHPRRLLGLAAVPARAVAAGTIDSSRGNASVTPVPLRNVRRERCFLLMNTCLLLAASSFTPRGFDYRFRLDAGSSELEATLFTFIWNGKLLTIPTTSAENRYSLRPASRTM